MRGISDLDSLCLREIFKNLTPLDLCSVSDCSKGLRSFVEDHFHSVYFIGEKLLDLTAESNGSTSKILKHFGQFCRHLKIQQKMVERNLMLDVIVTNCGKTLKRLSLNRVHLYEIDLVKFGGIFHDLEFLELIDCDGDEQCNEFEFPNLTTLRIINSDIRFDYSDYSKTELHKMCLMNMRSNRRLHDDLLPLIALNAPAIENLDISIDRYTRNLTSMAQLRNLKLLQINCRFDQRLITSLIRELSVICTKLEVLGLSKTFGHYDEEFWDALSNLTNLKQIRLSGAAHITATDDKSAIKRLVRKLSKLESFMFVDCYKLRYLDFLRLVRKSDKLRTVYVWETKFSRYSYMNIEQIIKDFTGEKRRSCFISGNPLCLYIESKLFNAMKILLTEVNVKSIERYGNIKIFQANREDFSIFPSGPFDNLSNMNKIIATN